ncbi:MAG: ROK family protein [Methanosarcinales archaeon]|nr:ROK family protein [Methanosarcinales archaeon]
MVSNSAGVDVVRRIDDLLASLGDDLYSRHRMFREELKELACKGDRTDLTLWTEEGNGKVSNEILTLPTRMFEPETERYKRLVEYVAVCLNIRGETLGIRQIGITAKSSGSADAGVDANAGTEIDIDRFACDVRGYFEREFFVTLLDANLGKPITWRRGKIEQGPIRVGQVRAGRYDQGKAVGLVVTGTDIKTVALESGNVVYRKEIAIVEGVPLEELLDSCIREASAEVGISQNEEIYIGVPGPVDPYGNIVRIPRIAAVTRESLERLQQRYHGIKFINDANVVAVYHRIVWAGDIATDQPTVALVLRKGIGFAILVDGQLASWVGSPMETHFRVNFRDDAPICNCGMRGCLELPAAWVVARFVELMSNRKIDLPPEFHDKMLCSGGECDLLAVDIGTILRYDGEVGRIAAEVFTEYGENLSTLFGELARLMGVSGFWVAFGGGMVRQYEERAAIIQGLAKGIDNRFPGLRIELLGGIKAIVDGDGRDGRDGGDEGDVAGRNSDKEAITRYERISGKWQGAVGAALCALQDKQMKMKITPETRLMIGEAEEVMVSEILDIFHTGKKLSTRTIIGVAGPSGGGKTYFARCLAEKIRKLGNENLNGEKVKVEAITMDDYLIQKEKRKKGGIREKYSLDRLWNDIIDINNGNPTSHPIFDQVSRVRFSRLGRFLDEKSAALGHKLSEENTDLFRRINQLTEWSGEARARLDLDEDTIVIIDGILALDDPTINKLYYDCRIFVHASWILRLCAAIARAQEESWYKGAKTADIIEKFVFKRPEEEAIINVTYLDADVLIENDFYEKKVNSDLLELLGEVYPRLDPDLRPQYYVVHAILKDHGYDPVSVFGAKLGSINELIRERRIEDMYEEGAGMRLEEDVCRMAGSGKLSC